MYQGHEHFFGKSEKFDTSSESEGNNRTCAKKFKLIPWCIHYFLYFSGIFFLFSPLFAGLMHQNNDQTNTNININF